MLIYYRWGEIKGVKYSQRWSLVRIRVRYWQMKRRNSVKHPPSNLTIFTGGKNCQGDFNTTWSGWCAELFGSSPATYQRLQPSTWKNSLRRETVSFSTGYVMRSSHKQKKVWCVGTVLWLINQISVTTEQFLSVNERDRKKKKKQTNKKFSACWLILNLRGFSYWVPLDLREDPVSGEWLEVVNKFGYAEKAGNHWSGKVL